jgi:hypothetical protein
VIGQFRITTKSSPSSTNNSFYYGRLLYGKNERVIRIFDLDEILEFQLENDEQIIRGEDYQYM